jgi:hypothetical protein
MRDAMRGWYPPTAAERASILDSGIIVLDTNALLKLYRFSYEDRSKLLELLDVFKDRLWLPKQIALEYHRGRLEVVFEQLDAYADLLRKIDLLKKEFVISVQAHPVLSQDAIKREIGDRLNGLKRFVEERRVDEHPPDLTDPLHNDGILDKITALYDGRVGPGLTLDAALLAEAQRRVDEKIPPGYRDSNKPVPRRYGDYFWWRETLEAWGTPDGTATTRGLLIVTEEKKPDWWRKEKQESLIVGPRPELVEEAASVGLSPFWMSSLERFYRAGAEHLGWEDTKLGRPARAAEPEGDAVMGGKSETSSANPDAEPDEPTGMS